MQCAGPGPLKYFNGGGGKGFWPQGVGSNAPQKHSLETTALFHMLYSQGSVPQRGRRIHEGMSFCLQYKTECQPLLRKPFMALNAQPHPLALYHSLQGSQLETFEELSS